MRQCVHVESEETCGFGSLRSQEAPVQSPRTQTLATGTKIAKLGASRSTVWSDHWVLQDVLVRQTPQRLQGRSAAQSRTGVTRCPPPPGTALVVRASAAPTVPPMSVPAVVSAREIFQLRKSCLTPRLARRAAKASLHVAFTGPSEPEVSRFLIASISPVLVDDHIH